MTLAKLSRSGPAILVVALHIVVIYAVSVSLGIVQKPALIKPSEVVFVPTQEQTVETEPVEVSEPDLAEPELTVPAPEVMPEMPIEESVMAAAPAETAPTSSMQELKPLNREQPTYPATSRRLGEEGSVQLRVLVSENGRPQQVEVHRSSGFSRLDEAAVKAVKRWRFQPASSGSGPVTAWSAVTITFRLQ